MASLPVFPDIEGRREWFTASELAEFALPELPRDKRSINRRAQEERWSTRTAADGSPLVRPHAGRGGGVDYHVSLLPGAARLELARRGIAEAGTPVAAPAPDAAGWQWFEAQKESVRRKAEYRLGIVREIELLKDSGMTATAAIAETAGRHKVSTGTLWNWLDLVKGVPAHNRLPALAPQFKGGGREVEIDPLLWTVFKSDFLRPSAPTLTSCYDRTAAIAAEKGLSMPSERTMRRRLEREVDPRIVTLRRKGEEALRRSIPSQRRRVEDLHALECVNIDGHKFDVFVTPPKGGNPIRPVMVAIQDVRSSRVLAWRVGETESAALARLAFADLFRDYGIPKHAVLDNGRGFASKWLTGAARTRFRFKIMDEEPTGLLVALGIEIHWALPYRGQSKPIERAFRDLCDTIARHPATEGAYTGNSPVNKPENYGKRAMGWDEFQQHVERGIARHNAKLGRRGRDYRGRSFDQVFADTWREGTIGKASPEHLRMALLAAEQVRVDRRTGEIALFGNRYWAEGCARLHGQRVTVRFDPDNLHSEVHLYGQDGGFLLTADVIDDTGFLDAAGAKASAKRWADVRRQVRAAAEAEELIVAEELAALQADAPAPPPVPAPTVIRPVRHRGQTAAALKPQPDESRARDRVSAVLRLVGEAD